LAILIAGTPLGRRGGKFSMIETAAAGVNARIGDLRAHDDGFSAKLIAARRARAAAMAADATADGALAAEAIAATDGDDTLYGTDQDDTLQGGLGNDTLRGRGGNDQLQGDEGNDLLDGGLGGDRMTGGAGDDTFLVDDAGDTAIELLDGGIDTVRSTAVATILGGHVEHLILLGDLARDGTGNALANAITGNAQANSLAGGSGDDTLIGGAAADRLTGGRGNDLYYVDVAQDRVVEAVGEGSDTVRSTVSFNLSWNIENLVLAGSSDLRGTGNGLSNRITGNSGANRLDGMVGADRLTGAGGNDTYVVDDAGDRAVELAGGGVDVVEASVSHALGANVENLIFRGYLSSLTGTGNGLDNVMKGSNNASDKLNGGSGDDSLSGGDGSDILNGGAGTDTLTGGQGNDTYVVDSLSDKIVENGGYDHDTVQCAFSYVLGEGLENLVLTGRSALNGTGNAAENVITGNAAANVLDGGTGADTLVGGGGNDRYILDTVVDYNQDLPGDQVVELADGGIDTVETSVGYQMNDHVENAILTGADDLWCTGNGLANTITGNAGKNILYGNGGGDTLAGGAGDDIYDYVFADDTIVERADGGVDWVYGIEDHVLAANVENVSLLYGGGRDIDATGNGLANFVGGGEGDNVLDGGAGDDTLSGLRGTDVLTGGTGVDAFNFGISLGSGVDTITDFNAANETVRLFKNSFTALGDLGELAAGAFHTGSTAQAADDRIIYNKTTGNIFYDADGSGSGAAVMFARVTAGTELTHANFEVI
jgi:Ca2+-binding RTX toxin-like protein